jgi:flagellar motor switch/type III secretory pathway protein FliN
MPLATRPSRTLSRHVQADGPPAGLQSIKKSEVRDRVMLANDSVAWRDRASGFVTSLAPAAHVPIACAMLGLETGTHKLSSDDHRVLRELAQISIQDLSVEIAKIIGLSGALDITSERQIGAQFRYALAMGGATQLFEVLMSEQRGLEARAFLMGVAPVSSTPLHERREALDRQSIRVSAMVGRGRLGLGELKRLSPGDVIVLDRGPDDELSLAINGLPINASCTVLCDGDDLRMRIARLGMGRS